MEKNKKVIIGVAAALIVLSGGGAAFAFTHHTSHQSGLSLFGDSSESPETATNTTEQSGSSSVPLIQTSPTKQVSSGLNVSSDTAANRMGQITPDQNQKNNQSGGSSGASGTSNSSNPIDPSTFSQYEKYKDGTSALFGDVQKGEGAELTDGKKAAVYYKGWLTNGTLFDQSRPGSDGKLQPFIFQMGAHQVIPGWEQALTGMKVGGVRLLIVPSSVGYGATGQGSIPPNALLVFQVQLAEVQ
ncbi:MAG: FKBP-type peptidyl-prolyl cis-trans isomerase [Patescibacteria group bacterium]|nr:FKBP-type peptidyl-prolyl cis-trans isomerase [Patescibacteria group bacterium]